MSTAVGARRQRVIWSITYAHWLCYGGLVAVLICAYMTILVHGAFLGVDFACFRAASIVLAQGGNPYDFGQLWHAENALYNLPHHVRPGTPAYYALNRYYNPPLFATLLWPLARLPYAVGYGIYATIAGALAALGAWFVVQSLGWTRHRQAAIALTLVSPCVFLTVWNGQQSTLLLAALGLALSSLRRGHPGLAGAALALGWVKPHLLVPIALAVPLVGLSGRAMLRMYGGFAITTMLGVVATAVLSGPASITAWLHTLFGYTGYVDAIQNYLPSLSGMLLVLLPHPWNRSAAMAVLVCGLIVMAVVVWRSRAGHDVWTTTAVLMAAWLLFTPFAHTNDDVLLMLPLAVAWGSTGSSRLRPLPVLGLWSLSTLSLAFLVPGPYKLLGVVPPALAFIAALRVWAVAQAPARHSQGTVRARAA